MQIKFVRFLFFVVLVIGLMFLAKWLGQAGVNDTITGGIGLVVAILIYSVDLFLWSFSENKNSSKTRNKNS